MSKPVCPNCMKVDHGAILPSDHGGRFYFTRCGNCNHGFMYNAKGVVQSGHEEPLPSNVLLARADALCSAAVSYAGDTGLHSEAWLWDKIREYQAARDSSSHEPFHSLASEPSAANSGQCESRKTAQSGTGAGLSLPPEVGPMCIICGESFSRHSIKYELVNMFAPNAVKFACPAVTKEGEV